MSPTDTAALASQTAAPAALADQLQPVTGDYILNVNVSECKVGECTTTSGTRSGKSTLEIVFESTAASIGARATYNSYSLDPLTGSIELLRFREGARTVLQTVHTNPASWRDSGTSPLIIELLRRGTFYLLYVGGSHLTLQPVAYVERPSSDVHCKSHTVDPEPEPLSGFTGYKDVSGGVFQLNSKQSPPQLNFQRCSERLLEMF